MRPPLPPRPNRPKQRYPDWQHAPKHTPLLPTAPLSVPRTTTSVVLRGDHIYYAHNSRLHTIDIYSGQVLVRVESAEAVCAPNLYMWRGQWLPFSGGGCGGAVIGEQVQWSGGTVWVGGRGHELSRTRCVSFAVAIADPFPFLDCSDSVGHGDHRQESRGREESRGRQESRERQSVFVAWSDNTVQVYTLALGDGECAKMQLLFWFDTKDKVTWMSPSTGELASTGESGKAESNLHLAIQLADGHIMVIDSSLLEFKTSQRMHLTRRRHSTSSRHLLHAATWNVNGQPPPVSPAFWGRFLGFARDGGDTDMVPTIILVALQEVVDLESKAEQLRGNAEQVYQWRVAIQSHLPATHAIINSVDMVGLVLFVISTSGCCTSGYTIGGCTIGGCTIGSCTIGGCTSDCRTSDCTTSDCTTSGDQMAPALALSHQSTSTIKCGLRGRHGNKGAVAWRALLHSTPLCVVNCHLAAGQHNVSDRNADAALIMKTLHFPPIHHPHHPLTQLTDIMDHQVVLWMGDLNYRVDVERECAVAMVRAGDYTGLLKADQLLNNLPTTSLHHLHEPPISFPPTYKYDPMTDLFDTSPKQRTPAYCDRILHKPADCVAVVRYGVVGEGMCLGSDHKPVVCVVRVEAWRGGGWREWLLFKCDTIRRLLAD